MAHLGEPEGGHFFAGGGMDRAAADAVRADPELLQPAMADPNTRFIVVTSNRRGPRLLYAAEKVQWATLAAVQGLGLTVGGGADDATSVLLGRSTSDGDVGGWCFALDASEADDDAILALGGKLISGRALMQAERSDASIGGHALAMLNWHHKNLYSGVSGAPTLPIEAGLKRTGPGRGERFYPRIDVAVIMLVMHGTDRDKAMLGQYQQSTFFTCLAGFVEQGESIEEACRRETFEETGIEVGRVQLHSSQPWPIGRAGACELMVGCMANATSDDIQVNIDEMGDAQWFDRATVKKMLAIDQTQPDEEQGLFGVPGEHAIAHHLIKAWSEGFSFDDLAEQTKLSKL
jgi:NADH pyrophosphatase NudC (nudix superfamily)